MLSDKQQSDYVKNPHSCPHCGSTNLETTGRDSDFNQVWLNIACVTCEKTWKDIYTLTSIEEESV